MSAKIAFFDTKSYDRQFFDEANKGPKGPKGPGFSINYIETRLSRATVALAEGASVVCIFVNDTADAAIIDELYKRGVKLIALRSAGYNNVDFRSAYGKVHVVRVPAYSPNAVAEHAVALMLSLNRKIYKAYDRTRDGNFSIQGLLGFDMAEKTAGIIGTGAIGKVMIKILKGFGMQVLAYDVKPDPDLSAKEGFSYVALDELYKRSDIISLHCPLTKETFHMINGQSLGMMKKGVMIINTGRGKLIDTKALIEALKDLRVGYAGLDVYEEESEYFFEDRSGEVLSDDVLARLLTFPNVLVTAHQGFFTREALSNIASITLKNIDDFMNNRLLVNEVCYKCERNICEKKEKGKCF